MPRRMASYDYTDPAIAPEALSVSISVFGGLLLLISAGLFFAVLIRGHRAPQTDPGEYRFSVAVHEPVSAARRAQRFCAVADADDRLTVINYGYPIAQLLALKGNAVPAVYVGAAR
jgi:cytochrome c oxidase subunit 1